MTRKKSRKSPDVSFDSETQSPFADDLEELKEDLYHAVQSKNCERAQILVGTVKDTISEWKSSLDMLKGKKRDEEAKEIEHTIRRLKLILLRNEAEVMISTAQSEAAKPAELKPPKSAPLRVQLPEIRLPRSSGNVIDFPGFIQHFNDLVFTDNSISNRTKMHYLQSCLDGEAAELSKQFEASDDNFLPLLHRLYTEYDKPSLRKIELWKKLEATPGGRSLEELRSTTINLKIIISQLRTMGEPVNSISTVMKLRLKFPEWLLNQTKPTDSADGTLDQISDVISKQLEFKAGREPVQSRPQQQSSGPQQDRPRFVPNTQSYSRKCMYCENTNHMAADCTQYPLHARIQRLKELKRCFKCAKLNHTANSCTAHPTCGVCQGPHLRSLCTKNLPQNHQETRNASGANAIRISTTQWRKAPSAEASVPTARSVSALTFKTTIVNETTQQETSIVGLLDSGAQATVISQSAASRIGLHAPSKQNIIRISGICDQIIEVPSQLVNFGIKASEGNLVPMHALCIQKRLTSASDIIKIRDDSLPIEPSNITESTVTPELIIGLDYFPMVLRSHYVTKDKLAVYETLFGSILATCTSTRTTPHIAVNKFRIQEVFATTQAERDKAELRTAIDDFWELDRMGIAASEWCPDDQEASRQVKSSLKFTDGRYHVSWPRRTSNAVPLSKTFGLCAGRLQHLRKKLTQQPDQLERYKEVISEQELHGIIEKTTKECEAINETFYLPHHPVFKGSKIRIVYDASAKTTGQSLNQHLLRGPARPPDLLSILLKMRQPKIMITGDIEKAFLQVGLHERDRDLTRFLWLKDWNQPVTGNNLEIYRFCRVPFGVVSSPFLLDAAVKEHLSRWNHPKARTVWMDTYVDNFFLGAETDQEATELIKDVRNHFKLASMNIRDFVTSSPTTNENIEQEARLQTGNTHILGVQWNNEKDEFSITFNDGNIDRPTRRSMLKDVASTFDPLGLASPWSIRWKTILQKTWNEKLRLGWDDRLPQELENEWRKAWPHDAVTTSIPRQFPTTWTLHVFADASQYAYAAVAYAVSETTKEIRFIYAKSRVRPKKEVTIPKLELIATWLGGKIAANINSVLTEPRTSVLWTDSTAVLGWINNPPQTTFVRNRVHQIVQNVDELRHVPTERNPADLATRGPATTAEKSSLWLDGPRWLFDQPRTTDKPIFTNLLSFSATPELSPTKEGTLNVSTCSTWTKLLKASGTILRFLKRTIEAVHKRKSMKGEPTTAMPTALKPVNLQRWDPETLRCAETMLINDAQRRTSARHAVTFELHKNEDHTLVTTGRMGEALNSTLIFLPPQADISKHLISHYHANNLHCSPSTTLQKLRERFWLPRGKTTVRGTIHRSCLQCRRRFARPMALPPFPNLPRSRVTESSPFSHTGLDNFGPITTKDQGKVWGLLFTCLSTRAIHLELVPNLTTEAFLLAFTRFAARRQWPTRILSDNSRTFTKANDEFNELWRSLTLQVSTSDKFAFSGTKWDYITALAPWKGGAYERMVGVTKSLLKARILERLHADELRTLLCQAEDIVNSRPITTIDSDDMVSLTPNDFLKPAKNCLSQILATDTNDNDATFLPGPQKVLVDGLRKIQSNSTKMWHRWCTLYLPHLRSQTQRFHASAKRSRTTRVKVGDVVLLQDPSMSTNPGRYPLAKIIHLNESADQEIREVTVQTANGRTLRRPPSLLLPLELDYH